MQLEPMLWILLQQNLVIFPHLFLGRVLGTQVDWWEPKPHLEELAIPLHQKFWDPLHWWTLAWRTCQEGKTNWAMQVLLAEWALGMSFQTPWFLSHIVGKLLLLLPLQILQSLILESQNTSRWYQQKQRGKSLFSCTAISVAHSTNPLRCLLTTKTPSSSKRNRQESHMQKVWTMDLTSDQCNKVKFWCHVKN